MASKSRRKRERNAEGRAQGSSRGGDGAPTGGGSQARRTALLVTLGIFVVGAAAAIFFSVRAQQPRELVGASSAITPRTGAGGVSSPGTQGAAASANLDAAADAVGFHIIPATSVGLVENLPADTTLLAPSRTLLPVGATAPDFTLFTPDGTRVRLSDYRGKTVFLEFFATWCPHCQAEAPHLLRLYNTIPSANIAFLSVNGDSEDAASVHAFTRHFGLPWPALLDPGSPPGSFREQGGIGPVSRTYGLALFPTFYIIDAKGLVAWRADREQPDQLILQKLRDVSES